MGTRQGTLLEQDVVNIFELAGFKVKHQHKINGYEIDTYAKKDNLTIACECKQYEKSDINIRNLIHQWDSKNKEIKVSRILLVFYGVEISLQEYRLAKKYNIILWEGKDVFKYRDLLNENRKKGSEILLKDFKLNKISKAKEDDLFENVILDKEIPLTKSIKIMFEDEIIGDAEVIIEPNDIGEEDNPIRTTDLDICFVRYGNEKELNYWVQSKHAYIPQITMMWLNSNKEIIKIKSNQSLSKGLFSKYDYFKSNYAAKYCLALIYRKNHDNLQVRDKLIFIEVK